MPYRINGFGTGYYGKANIHRLRAQCEHCNQIGVLESYDTTLFITGLYVPLIPIGGKRILESCPSCTTHRAVPLSSWNKSKEEHKADLVEKLQANPNDKEALKKALGVSIAYQDHGLFELLHESIIGDRTDDADIQYTLGQAHRFFGEPAQAADAYRRSLTVRNNPEVHEELALLLLGMKNPKEAEKHIEHLLTEPNKEKLWLPYNLVVGYQAEGMHQEAAQVLDKVEQLYPDTAKDKDWTKLRTIATKYQNSQKKVGSPLQLSAGSSTNEKGSAFANRIPLLIFPLLLVGFAIWHACMALYIANNRTIHVVGALATPYQVSLNGQEITLSPYQVTTVVLPEGDISIEAGKGAPAGVAGKVHFETSFWTRPYVSPVLVINPDRLVIFYVETGVYSNPPGQNPPPDYFVNNNEYFFSEIDFPFAFLPDTLQAKKNQTLRRKALNIVKSPSAAARADIVTETAGAAGFSEYTMRWLESDLDNPLLLRAVTQSMPRDKALEFYKARLFEKPIRIEWHRAYQDLYLQDGKDDTIKPEYKKLVTDSGRDPATLYLLARISSRPEALVLLNEAVNSGKPAPLAHYSLGYHYLCEGKFQEAAKEMDQAKELIATSPIYAQIAMDAYLAAKQFEAIYKLLDSPNNHFTSPLANHLQRYYFRLIEGNFVGADETKKALLIAAGNPKSGLERASIDLGINFRNAQARGDIQKYLQIGQTNPGTVSKLRMAILSANVEEAINLLGKEASNSNADQVSDKGLILLALPGDNHPKAKELKSTFLVEMGKRRDEQELRDIMSKKAPFDMEKIRKSLIHPNEKRVLLYLTAKWLPDHAKELRELAAQLNYQKDEVALCLKKLTP